MTLKPLDPDQAEKLRDSIEAGLADASSAGMREYLGEARDRTLAAVRAGGATLVAAGSGETPTLGELAGMWAAHVDERIMPEVTAAFMRAYRRWSTQAVDMDSPELSGARDYLARVRDRLVRGTYFGVSVYEQSFDLIRGAIAESYAEGWSRGQLAQRIANELAWETNGPYWRSQLDDYNRQIDNILDPLGPPGSAVREAARASDPRVLQLQELRSRVVRKLDDEYSVWKDRANLIARTESTGVANYGGMSALTAEGVATKVWCATGDRRTRLSHRAASGQEASLASPFVVGQALLQFPGDPNGPVGEIANCRCTMVGGDYLSPSDRDFLKQVSEGENTP